MWIFINKNANAFRLLKLTYTLFLVFYIEYSVEILKLTYTLFLVFYIEYSVEILKFNPYLFSYFNWNCIKI